MVLTHPPAQAKAVLHTCFPASKRRDRSRGHPTGRTHPYSGGKRPFLTGEGHKAGFGEWCQLFCQQGCCAVLGPQATTTRRCFHFDSVGRPMGPADGRKCWANVCLYGGADHMLYRQILPIETDLLDQEPKGHAVNMPVWGSA